MNRVYCTFSGANYEATTALIVESARAMRCAVLAYDDEWLEAHPFHQQNRWLFEHHQQRGFGWYAWKPLIILDALERSPTNSVVLYSDADTVPIADLGVLYEIAFRDGIMVFESSGNRNRQWCKRDAYIVMCQDQPKFWNSQAAVARFMLFRKGDYRNQQFLWEWLTYCVNPLATTFDPSVLGRELEGFVEHRTEQAILTLLAHKYGYRLYREADQSGERHNYTKDKDLYGQLFDQRPTTTHLNVTAPVLGSKYRNV